MMDFVFNVVFRESADDIDHRKELIRWLNGNVGVRGTDWAIAKPRGNPDVCRVRIADKAKAALVKMMYVDIIVPDEKLHKSYIR